MTDDDKATKPKKAKRAKRATIPPNPTRTYGATVYTRRTEDTAEAARLIGDCEFRLVTTGPDGYHLIADSAAYAKYKAG